MYYLFSYNGISLDNSKCHGYDQLSRQQMTLSNTAPDENNEIHFTVTVPSASSSFSKEVRQHVSLDGLYLIAVISSAAKIMPLDGAPSLGLPGNYEIGRIIVMR